MRRWDSLFSWVYSKDFVQSLASSYAITKLLVIEINFFFSDGLLYNNKKNLHSFPVSQSGA